MTDCIGGVSVSCFFRPPLSSFFEVRTTSKSVSHCPRLRMGDVCACVCVCVRPCACNFRCRIWQQYCIAHGCSYFSSLLLLLFPKRKKMAEGFSIFVVVVFVNVVANIHPAIICTRHFCRSRGHQCAGVFLVLHFRPLEKHRETNDHAHTNTCGQFRVDLQSKSTWGEDIHTQIQRTKYDQSAYIQLFRIFELNEVSGVFLNW